MFPVTNASLGVVPFIAQKIRSNANTLVAFCCLRMPKLNQKNSPAGCRQSWSHLLSLTWFLFSRWHTQHFCIFFMTHMYLLYPVPVAFIPTLTHTRCVSESCMAVLWQHPPSSGSSQSPAGMSSQSWHVSHAATNTDEPCCHAMLACLALEADSHT